jgi:hypothetical protein
MGYLSTAEISKKYNTVRATISMAILKGYIKAIKKDGKWCVDKDSAEKYFTREKKHFNRRLKR